MQYIATALEIEPGEAEKYGCISYEIEQGVYLSKAINGWRQQLDQIQEAFMEIMKDQRADATKPAIEWYKNEEQLFCMVKMIQG